MNESFAIAVGPPLFSAAAINIAAKNRGHKPIEGCVIIEFVIYPAQC
jgi:hypothetical protein